MIRNSTISVKKKNCISCGKLSYIFSKKRCADCSRIEDTTKRMEKETNRIIEQEDLCSLIADADTVFSKFIRLSAANKETGECECYTCRDKKHWTMQQCGHYISRAHLFLRHDPRNARPQCEECNCYKHGNIAAFTKRLNQDFPGLPEILKEESTIVFKPSREELKQLINEYSVRLKQLKAKL